MPIENEKDKQIQDLLENNYPLKAIKVDFKDLNNKNLVIKSSFKEAYTRLNDEEKKDNWFYIGELNVRMNTINIVGLINMTVTQDGWLKIYWIETNKVFRNKGYTKEIIEYLKRYVQWKHWRGAIAVCEKTEDMHHFKFNGFKPLGNNSLEMKWENS